MHSPGQSVGDAETRSIDPYIFEALYASLLILQPEQRKENYRRFKPSWMQGMRECSVSARNYLA